MKSKRNLQTAENHSELIENLSETFKQVPKSKKTLTEEQIDALLKKFVVVTNPEFAKKLMAEVDKDNFFDFGEYLISQLANPTDKTKRITHEYLNLFRYPSFLRKIYEENKGR